MDVISTCPLSVASRVWQPSQGAFTLTVVCRATFQLRAGEAVLAVEQEAPNDHDDHWNDDDLRSLRAASDMAPIKPRADVLLVGAAFAPGRVPTRSLVVRLCAGEVDKSIEVVCDRSLSPDGTVREGAPFARMPLVYERAAGGPGTLNPVGIRRDLRDAQGRIALPNLQRPGVTPASLADPNEPLGFGPIAPSWPGRMSKLGRHAATFSAHGALDHLPLPSDLDASYFNVAPADQQVPFLSESTVIALENLHPDHPRLTSRLPGLGPRATVEGQGGARALDLRCDTLWIDTDRGICTLVWRGQVPLGRRDEPGRVIVAMDRISSASPSGRRPTWASADLSASAPQPPAMFLDPNEVKEAESVDSPVGTIMITADQGPSMTLPFAPPPLPPPPPPGSQPHAGLPFAQPPAKLGASAVDWSAMSPLPPPPAPVAPPVASAEPRSPWAGGSPLSAAAAIPDLRVLPGGASNTGDVPGGGLLAASNAAAAAMAVPSLPRPQAALAPAAAPAPIPIPRVEAGTVLHLLWFDTDAVPRMRRKPEWRKILNDFDQRPLDPEIDDPALAKEPMDVEDRREVFEILAQGEAAEDAGLSESISDGVRDGGKFVPPLVLLGGELRFAFDEVETLKATMATASPFTTGEEMLIKALKDARDFLSIPDLLCPPAVAEGLTKRIEDAFPERKGLGSAYLEEQRTRVLLTGRRYQRRELLGDTFLRALLQVGGSSRVLPAYLPDKLAKKLPMFERFKARLIGEVCLSEDQYEPSPVALRVLAVGRVASAPGRR
ncbi:MAG: DUF2169 domain-containing protein [Byssovorax sp.]